MPQRTAGASTKSVQCIIAASQVTCTAGTNIFLGDATEHGAGSNAARLCVAGSENDLQKEAGNKNDKQSDYVLRGEVYDL